MNKDKLEQLDELSSKLAAIQESIDALKESIKYRDDDDDESTDDSSGEDLAPAIKEKIQSIMDNFAFDKVRKVMELLNWRWAFSEGVPTMDELRKEARRLLVESAKERLPIATGGFRAVWEDDPNGLDPYIGLEFIVEECEGFTNDEA